MRKLARTRKVGIEEARRIGDEIALGRRVEHDTGPLVSRLAELGL